VQSGGQLAWVGLARHGHLSSRPVNLLQSGGHRGSGPSKQLISNYGRGAVGTLSSPRGEVLERSRHKPKEGGDMGGGGGGDRNVYKCTVEWIQ
jgi:hypothetical protein